MQVAFSKKSVKWPDATIRSERFFGPLVLFHDLSLFFRREVVLNVKELANLRHSLVLDQTGDLGAGQFEQRLDVQVVAGHDQLEEHLLVEVDKVRVPCIDDGSHIGGDERLVDLGGLVVLHAGAEHDDLFEDGPLDVGKGDLFFFVFVHNSLDEDGSLGDVSVDKDGFTVTANELNFRFCHVVLIIRISQTPDLFANNQLFSHLNI